MMTVLLSILRVIGIILLILLCVVLVLVLLILFMPIVYRLRAEKQAKTEATVKIRWLFGLIRAEFQYPDPGIFKVKVLFFTVFETGGQETTEDADANADASPDDPDWEVDARLDSDKDDTAGNNTARNDTVWMDAVGNDAGKREDADAVSSKKAAEHAESAEKAAEHAEAWREVEAKLHGEPAESKIDKIKYTFRNTCDKIKDTRKNIGYYKEILTDDETRQLLDHALLRIGRILKSIRPRKLEADLLFGTGSPDTTGYILGVYAMFYPVLGKHFLVTPDFEEKILKGHFYAAGHITIAKILWQVVLVVLDKKLWHLIAKVKKEKKHGKQRK